MSGKRNPKFRKAKSRPAAPGRAPAVRAAPTVPAAPTYEDLAQIVGLLRSTSRFSEFRLRSGDIEVEVKRANGEVRTEVRDEPGIAAQVSQPEKQVKTENLTAGTVLVRAPMVGTFYRSPEPGAPPFVEPGGRVAADTTVCIIEVMKLMNSIPAGCAGTVTHVLVKDAGTVEFGQPLVAIKPDA